MTMDVDRKKWMAPIKHVHGCEKERKGCVTPIKVYGCKNLKNKGGWLTKKMSINVKRKRKNGWSPIESSLNKGPTKMRG